MNKGLKNVDDFYKEFDETCTKKAIINDLGANYIKFKWFYEKVWKYLKIWIFS